MMKKIITAGTFILACGLQSLQGQTAAEMHATGKSFMQKGDYSNAVLVLTRSVLENPNDIETQKDLAQSLYFQGNYDKALNVIKPVMDNPNADDQVFLIAGKIYKQTGDPDGEKDVYKKALKRFPNDGMIYNNLGELQFNQKNFEAIKTWEKGIEADPSYSRNYFNAARYYFFTKDDKVWSLIYGEIFVNIEPNNPKTQEMKQILLEGYKKLFSVPDLEKENKDKSDFAKAFLSVMNKESAGARAGITPESLSAIRSKFLTDWFAVPGRPAYKLFDMQKQLQHEGMFDTYNQWLFGAAASPAAYDAWIKAHPKEVDAFVDFQKNRVFTMPPGQYYK